MTVTTISRRARLLVVPGASLVALCVVAVMHSLAVVDIMPYDETLYLTLGRQVPEIGLPTFGWGPLYADIYFLWSVAVADPIVVALLGPATASALFVTAVWVSIRLHASSAWAFVGGAVATVLPMTYLQAGVGRIAGGLALLAVAVAFRWNSPRGYAVSTSLIWLAAGFRPEAAYLATLLTIGLFIGAAMAVIKGDALGHPRRGWGDALLIVGGTLGTLLVLHGSPFVGSRVWSAFAQHFAFQHSDEGYDMAQESGVAMTDYFPGATSVVQAFMVNPRAMVDFVVTNGVNVPGNLARFMFPRSLPGLTVLPAVGLVLVFVVGIAAPLVLRRRRIFEDVRRLATPRDLATRVIPLTVLTAVVAAAFGPILLIYAEMQYMVGLGGLAIFGATVFVARYTRGTAGSALTQVGVAACWIAFALTCVAGVTGRIASPPILAASLRTIAEAPETVSLLAGDDGSGLAIYTPRLRLVDAATGDGATDFAGRLRAGGVDAVLISSALDFHPWAKLPGFGDFVADPAVFGFRPVVPDSPIWIRE